MQDIKVREEKIKEKRKQTPRREFVKEIGSWFGTYFGKKDGIISRYPDTERVGKTISSKEFEANRDVLIKYGRDYSFDKTFFQNFQDLFKDIPLAATLVSGYMENSDYADDVINVKNVYLSFAVVTDTTNVLYSFLAKDNSNNVLNSVSAAYQSENIYMCTSVTGSFNVFYSKFINDSSNVRFSSNLIGCQECLFCDNLQNQSYQIRNVQYTKEEYKSKKEFFLNQKNMFSKRYDEVSTQGNNIFSKNAVGNAIVKSENIENGTIVYQVEDGRNLFMAGGSEGDKNLYDLILGGSVKGEDLYGVTLCGIYVQNIYCSCHIETNCSNVYYSHSLTACSYCLGCRGLKNKQFCILNKEYSKEERFDLANKIFAQMEKDGILGKYFPGTINPFYFNDTTAYLIDGTFTKEEVEKDGYMRRDEGVKVDIPAGADVIATNDLASFQGFDDQGNRTINPEILKKVIKDEKGNYYRIVKMEYDFLMKHGLPLPELHWLERIKLGFKFK